MRRFHLFIALGVLLLDRFTNDVRSKLVVRARGAAAAWAGAESVVTMCTFGHMAGGRSR